MHYTSSALLLKCYTARYKGFIFQYIQFFLSHVCDSDLVIAGLLCLGSLAFGKWGNVLEKIIEAQQSDIIQQIPL